MVKMNEFIFIIKGFSVNFKYFAFLCLPCEIYESDRFRISPGCSPPAPWNACPMKCKAYLIGAEPIPLGCLCGEMSFLLIRSILLILSNNLSLTFQL